MNTRVCVRTSLIATFIAIVAVGVAPNLSAQNFQACGTLQQGLDCMFFHFGGQNYLLDNYGSFQAGDTVRVVGTFNITALCNCVTFMYPCIRSNTISAGSGSCVTLACCTGKTGDLSLDGVVDLADMSMMVAYLIGTIKFLPCLSEADLNLTGVINLADLSAMVSYLSGSGYVLPNCP